MTRRKSSYGTSEAEEESHENLDSQAMIDALKAELGVGRTHKLSSGDISRSDAHTSAERAVFLRSTAAGGSAVSKTQFTSFDVGVNDFAKNIHLHRGSAAQRVKTNDAVLMQSSSVAAIDPATQDRTSQQKRMETSQQTPTQVNEGRDYGAYYNNVESSPPLADTLAVEDEHEPLVLMDDETGAVDFGNLSPGARQSSQVSEDIGFQNTRSEWRSPRPTSQRTSNYGFNRLGAQDPSPETPILPRNPFGARHDAAIPFAGSQLFKQTQLPTSAVKISPTSSRPSPNMPYESMLSRMVEESPLMNRTNVSSPTVVQTSSPQPLHDAPLTSGIKQKSAPPLEGTSRSLRTSRRDLTNSSPTVKLLRSSQIRQPLAHYEPMKRSQERKAADEAPIVNVIQDSDSDGEAFNLERRRRIEKKRAQAAREMEKISFVRPAQREFQAPPGRKRRRINDGARATDIEQMEANDVKEAEQSKSIEEILQRSSRASASLAGTAESTKATPGDHIEQTCSNDNIHSEEPEREPRKLKEMTDEEMIPATSPVRSLSPEEEVGRGAQSASELELPPQLQREMDELGDGKTIIPPAASDSPFVRRRTQRSYGRQSRAQRKTPIFRSSIVSENESPHPSKRQKNLFSESSNAAPVAALNAGGTKQNDAKLSSSPSSPTKPTQLETTPSRQGDQTPATSSRIRAASPAVQNISSQSSLTPVSSLGTTPEIGLSSESERQTSVSLPSSATGRKGQPRASRQLLKSGSPQLARRVMRTGTRGIPPDINSTDELQRSPSSSAPALSVTASKSSRTLKQLIGPNHLNRGRRLLENMAFAISMHLSEDKDQRRKDQYKRFVLEQKITQAGGTILQDGFHELFEASAVMSNNGRPTEQGDAVRLLPSSMDYGFTALIGDEHSRKAKYMQALALGIPCLAHQWITVCLNKSEIVDWEPYLLAAGSPAALEGAIRSRCLQPYPAKDAKLVEVVERRPRLLTGQSLLVVADPKRARDETNKEQYIFLALALGPSVHRVSTTKEAHEALNARRIAKEPFDWIYVDEATGTMESVLSGGEPLARKRKRSSVIPIRHDVRILEDELLIQSLISGRVIGEDEMNF